MTTALQLAGNAVAARASGPQTASESMLVIGVDPGLAGAIAVLNGSRVEWLADLPVIRDRRLAWVDGNALYTTIVDALAGRPARAVVERVSAMPRQGVASAFTFGVGLGSVLAILQAIQIPIELVTPAVWKRVLGLGSDKNASLDKARLLFPSADLRLAKHHGRAEALLLAHSGRVGWPETVATAIGARP